MSFNKIVGIITKVGAVVIATVGSFVITPPVIDPEIQVVNWHNLFVFGAGILGVVLSARSESNLAKNQKRTGIALIVSLIVLVGLYEFAYHEYSRSCFDKARIVVGTKDTLLPSVLQDYERWANDPDPIRKLLEGHSCESLNVWPAMWIMIPYWGILTVYLAISALVTFSISFIASVRFNKDEI